MQLQVSPSIFLPHPLVDCLTSNASLNLAWPVSCTLQP